MSKSELTPIPSSPGYLITRDGQVWSEKRQKWLSVWVDKGGYAGYIVVGLRQGNRQCQIPIHRLLLETFVGPCPSGKECHHIDGDKQNNSLENLCWALHREHSTGTLKKKLNEYKVSWIKQLLATGKFTGRAIAKVFSVHEQTVSNIKTNKNWLRVEVV